MPLFQTSVLNKYLSELDKGLLETKYDLFKTYFLNTTIQYNIIASKEEEFQEGFLRELFVKVLGYTINPEPDFNLRTEHKNIKDNKKADGAIVDKENVLAVIELKGTDTTNLANIEVQAFSYKNNQVNCRYIVTSNFQKLRFYIDNAIEYVEWDLFKLDYENFKLLYLCLSKDNIFRNLPASIKEESISVEESITKKLYKEYSNFRRVLFNSIVELNPGIDKLLLFKKTQKLLDRFLFLFFAEDRMLVPPNSVRMILGQWTELKEKYDETQPLYDRFKKYFGYLNNGYLGKQHEIFAYNGGLFAADDVLDVIKIEDGLLYDATLSLSIYDYNSEVDVNILGHIFEHSLTEIEELEKEIESNDPVTTKATKRKKEGVFYTPKYITKYIVENTVGTLCKNKREELAIEDEDYHPLQKKKTAKVLLNNLNNYKEWLLHITIVDPACGSGAFLNQALEYLIAEHKRISELEANITGSSIVFDVENSILENNLFGVDINEESVDIAKLSLWLRTARKGRKLNSLNNNIKCGNSLIDNINVAGDKAFSWHHEFPQIFNRGGFDVVIGNPPYVDIKALPNNIVDFIFYSYKSANNRINLFSIFIEKACTILKDQGRFSFIIPSSILTQESYKPLRELVLKNTNINTVVRLPNESFGGSAGEVKVDTIILTFTRTNVLKVPIEILVYKGFARIAEINKLNTNYHAFIEQKIWEADVDFIFRINVNDDISGLLGKIEKETDKLIECAEFCLGLTPYDKYKGHTPEQINNRVFHSLEKKDDTYKKLLAGNDVTRYHIEWGGEEWISYGSWLGACRDQKFFKEKRILVKQIIDWSAKKIWAAMTEEELYNTQNAFNLIAKENYHTEYLLALINSSLISYYHRKKFLEEFKDRFQKILIKDAKEFPIKRIPKDQQLPFIAKVNIILFKNKELHQLKVKFLQLLKSKYEWLAFSKKLQEWPELSFKDYLKELSKQNINLSLNEQAEWMQFFKQEKQKVSLIKSEMDKTDKEIDKMVYELYQLNEAEIKSIEEC